MESHEGPLASHFKAELRRIPGLRLFGPPDGHPCTPTISFRLQDLSPREVAEHLADRGIFTWNGNFYAVELVRTLGLHESGGLVRIGLAPYNTREEVDFTLKVIRELAE
jgi:selenocysteine lyase/cysteine desulfurase